jgi:hypothetical protein
VWFFVFSKLCYFFGSPNGDSLHFFTFARLFFFNNSAGARDIINPPAVFFVLQAVVGGYAASFTWEIEISWKEVCGPFFAVVVGAYFFFVVSDTRIPFFDFCTIVFAIPLLCPP